MQAPERWRQWESTENVQVQRLNGGDIAFVPQDSEAEIVSYPGGKVQAEAYVPLMSALAERGFLGVIVRNTPLQKIFDTKIHPGRKSAKDIRW